MRAKNPVFWRMALCLAIAIGVVPNIAAGKVFLISEALNNGDAVQVDPDPDDGSFQILVGLTGEAFTGISGLRTEITFDSPTLELTSVALPPGQPGLLLSADPAKPTVLFITPEDMDPGSSSLPLFLVELNWVNTNVSSATFAMLINFEGFVEETEEEFSIPRQANLTLQLAAIPEPTPFALLLVGLGALGLFRIRRTFG